jgi:hypothetical protein
MAISKLLKMSCMLFAAICFSATSVVQAQVLPILNSFSNRTFNGTVDVSWPVLFDGCSFVTDSVVLRHSYGAVFRNCSFESKTGALYVADSGDGIILADCVVTGSDCLIMSRDYNPVSRNYIAGVTVNGEECSVLDEQESIIDIDGLELAESVRGGSAGPMFMLASSDCKVLESGDSAYLRLLGLEKGMFVGWKSSDDGLKLIVDDDGMGCRVYAADVKGISGAVISAYTEYGLEAAYNILVTPKGVESR